LDCFVYTPMMLEPRSLPAMVGFASRGVKILYAAFCRLSSPFCNDTTRAWQTGRKSVQSKRQSLFTFSPMETFCTNPTSINERRKLYNPALFAGIQRSYDFTTYNSDSQILERHPRHADLALEYLSIVRDLKSTTSVSAIKGHLFKIMHPGLIREFDLREKLGRVKINPKRLKEESAYTLICEEMKIRMEVRIYLFSRDVSVLIRSLERRESCGRSTQCKRFNYY
jgi:hypothetical protein